MKQQLPVNAGVLSVIAALLIILIVYTLLGTVDLVFMHEGRQISRMDNVNMLSEITLPEGDLTYTVGEETGSFETVEDLKGKIAVTLLTNLFGFKWQEIDHVITINQE
jgi:hypothetical protein